MKLDPKKADERLNSPNNLANRLSEFRKNTKKQLDIDSNTLTISAGRKLPRLPHAVKEEIEEKALSGEYTQQQLAEEYGVSQPAIGTIKRNAEARIALATDKNIDDKLKNVAIEKMLLSMGLIDEDSLASLRATELASVAAQMSKVYAATSPQKNQVAVNLVIYSPEVKEEKSYPIVEIVPQDQTLSE